MHADSGLWLTPSNSAPAPSMEEMVNYRTIREEEEPCDVGEEVPISSKDGVARVGVSMKALGKYTRLRPGPGLTFLRPLPILKPS